MKLTQMIEKFAKQGMLNGVARAELLQAAEETEQEMAELQEELSGKDGELAEKQEKRRQWKEPFWRAVAKNVKAILALLDLEEISYDAKEGLKGLDLEEVKAEAPYLFYEKNREEKGDRRAHDQTEKERGRNQSGIPQRLRQIRRKGI